MDKAQTVINNLLNGMGVNAANENGTYSYTSCGDSYRMLKEGTAIIIQKHFNDRGWFTLASHNINKAFKRIPK